MRILHAVLGLLVAGSVAAACTINQDNCDKNPECESYPGHKQTGTTGGGGTGGGMCAVPTDCQEPADKCKERTCEGGMCGTKDKDCGALTCDAMSGQCTGCDDSDPQKKCPLKDCHDVACTGGMCVETANGSLTCADGMGSCDDAGNCGTCDDGMQNGDETGVDCGSDTKCGRCDGVPCDDDAGCKSGFCIDGVCCDTACDGVCQACDQPGSAGTCSALAIGTPDGACDGSNGGCGKTLGYCRCNDGVTNGDETDVDCGGMACGQPCGTGHLCNATSDCISGFCADGYCCGVECEKDLECLACNLVGLEGLCTAVAPGIEDICSGEELCGGFGACAKIEGKGCGSADTNCVSNQCLNGSCNANCTGPNDCDVGQVCENGTCFARALQGQPCPSTAACQDGLTCVDSVCCESKCDGLCMACHYNYHGQTEADGDPANGKCFPILEKYDPHNECPQPDPSQPGPGGSAYCSGAPPDAAGNSSCAQPQPQQ